MIVPVYPCRRRHRRRHRRRRRRRRRSSSPERLFRAGTEFTGGCDRCDAFLEEPVILVLERDHDLRVVMVRVNFGLERLGRAERERGRDDAIDLAGTDGIADVWVQ